MLANVKRKPRYSDEKSEPIGSAFIFRQMVFAPFCKLGKYRQQATNLFGQRLFNMSRYLIKLLTVYDTDLLKITEGTCEYEIGDTGSLHIFL